MGIKLGDVSPLAGMISGKGIMADAARHGAFGLIGKYVTPGKEKEDKKVAPTAGGKPTMKKGGKVKKMAAGGSASRRADGCATKGKTKGRFV